MQNNQYQQNNQWRKPQQQQTSAYSSTSASLGTFKSGWITSGVTKEMVEFAEKIGKEMADNGLTSSQIRNIYGEVTRIKSAGWKKEETSFYLLKPKVAYALGRDPKNNGLKLFKDFFNKSYDFVSNAETFFNFCNLFEAVLAFHKQYSNSK